VTGHVENLTDDALLDLMHVLDVADQRLWRCDARGLDLLIALTADYFAEAARRDLYKLHVAHSHRGGVDG